MNIHTNVQLKNYHTMKIGGVARFMADAFSLDHITTLVASANQQQLPVFVIGSGSNVIPRDEPYNGLIIRNRLTGFEQIAEDEDTITFKIAAGEIWDDIVKKTVDMGLIGIEALSAIPGTCGAAPVQNIGAYGQEVSDTLIELEAFDISTGRVIKLSNDDCKFRYRDSIFRSEEKGRFIILSITLQLYKSPPMPPFYKALQDYLSKNNITNYTPQIIRDAVIAIRKEKLPDPAVKPNSGSFFKNTIAEKLLVDDLVNQYPDMPHFDMGGGNYKIPTGWLIEKCGFKGQLLYGIRVNPANALVLINESAQNYADLAQAREDIKKAVLSKFNMNIEQEPIEIV